LNQVTLNEVIENLSALRDGKEISDKKAVTTAPSAGKTVPIAVRPAEDSKSEVSELVSRKTAAPPDVASANVDELWHKLSEKIPAQKRFLKTLIDSTRGIGAEGRSFLIGYPPEQKSMIETLATDNNRRFLETLLKEISGRDWNVKFVMKEGLPAPVVNETAESAPAKKASSAETFKDDPLIKEALEIFKGEIKS
jgi:hypothetical protein